MLTFKRILCPTDFSEASYEALAKAVGLAEQGRSEICLLHVEPPLEAVTPLAGLAPYAENEVVRRAATIKNLCEVLEERVPASVRSHAVLKQGDAAEQIVRTAREEGADIILLTTHGARDWQPGILGDVAEAVVRTASCPVLIINGPPATRAAAKAVKDGALEDIGGALRPELEVVSSHRIYLDGD